MELPDDMYMFYSIMHLCIKFIRVLHFHVAVGSQCAGQCSSIH